MRTVAALCRELLPDHRSDGELVAAFTSERSEPAFVELIRRHGPLVWNVCRRVLPHPTDAEDAFQATFLVLVRQSAKLGGREVLGPWLHRVAVLTARNVRRKNARRLARQRELPEDAAGSAPDSGLKADIDGALLALPERYREPIILCHLQGFTRREAAARLGCAEGTLSAWLNRGLAKLRIRLRDLDPVKALSVPAVAVPVVLSSNTVQAAVASGVAATLPTAVSCLVEGVLHMLWIKKATAATFALCAVFVMGVGVGLGTRPGSTGVVAQDKPTAQKSLTVERAKNAPPATPSEREKLVAQIVEQIRVAEKQLLVRKGLLQATSDKIDLLRQLDPKAKTATEDLELLRRLEAELKPAEAELEALRAGLAKLKADKPKTDKPATAGDKESTLLKMDELKAQLAQIEAERGRLRAQADAAKEQLAVVESKLRLLEKMAADLAAQTARDKKAEAGWHIEIRVGKRGGEFVVTERRSDLRLSDQPGAVRTDDLWALTLLLQHAKADPNGPREVRVSAERDVTQERVKSVLDVCKKAGFAKVSMDIAEALDAKPNQNPANQNKLAEERLRAVQKALEEYQNHRDKKAPPTEAENRVIEEYQRVLEQFRRQEAELKKLRETKPESPARP